MKGFRKCLKIHSCLRYSPQHGKIQHVDSWSSHMIQHDQLSCGVWRLAECKNRGKAICLPFQIKISPECSEKDGERAVIYSRSENKSNVV